jgi:very-short-patch-repair endonuclease
MKWKPTQSPRASLKIANSRSSFHSKQIFDVGGGVPVPRSSDELTFIPYDFGLTDRARRLRKSMTVSERILWGELRGKKFKGLKFHRQKPLSHRIADFYCPKLKLVIEIDGKIHEKRAECDAERTCELSEYGLTVIRYTNDQVISDLKAVLCDISVHVASIQKKFFES